MVDDRLIDELEAEESMFVQTAQGITNGDGDAHVGGDHAVDAVLLRPATARRRSHDDRRLRRPVGRGGQQLRIGSAERGAGVPRARRDDTRGRGDRASRIRISTTAGSPYPIDVLEGTVPAQTGPVTLFIDPFGRPLSPVSVAGVRRRERRRMR